MIRRVLRVFGIPFLSLDTIHYEFETEEDEYDEPDEDEYDATEIGGGGTHDFERADAYVVSEFEGEPWDDEFKFGFGRRPQ